MKRISITQALPSKAHHTPTKMRNEAARKHWIVFSGVPKELLYLRAVRKEGLYVRQDRYIDTSTLGVWSNTPRAFTLWIAFLDTTSLGKTSAAHLQARTLPRCYRLLQAPVDGVFMHYTRCARVNEVQANSHSYLANDTGTP